MIVDIQVTEADIEAGTSRPDDCPIARALKRATGGTVWKVEPYTEDSAIATTGIANHVHLGSDCAEFIGCFDRDQYVAPFSFECDVPEELLS